MSTDPQAWRYCPHHGGYYRRREIAANTYETERITGRPHNLAYKPLGIPCPSCKASQHAKKAPEHEMGMGDVKDLEGLT